MPAFSKGSPYEKYAFNQVINYEYYLKQGRPSYAYCSFIVDEFKQFQKLSKKRYVVYNKELFWLYLTFFCL